MSVLLDTNVIITAVTDRSDPYLSETKTILSACSTDEIEGYMAFHSVSVLWYVLRKMKGEDEARERIEHICKILAISSATQEQVIDGIRDKGFKDFEDCLIDKCAVSACVDYIITANIKDYEHSAVEAIKPDEFCKMIND